MGRVFLYKQRGENVKKSVAIIVDGQFLLHRLKDALGLSKYPDATVIKKFLYNLIIEEEEIYRIFFYQGEPSKQKSTKPISKEEIEFKDSETAIFFSNLLNDLAKQELIAVRVGETQFRGWKLQKWVEKKILEDDFNETLTDDHFTPDFQQKGVDIKIGLDVAWLSSKSLVDRIILITGDSDFVPAMKFARREGLQVILVKIGPKHINESLEIHSDFIRTYSNQDVLEICLYSTHINHNFT